MAEILLPSKKDVEDAIVYSNLAGRNFVGQNTPVLVYFMPDAKTAPGYKPYTDAQVAADPTLPEVNASYVGIDPSKYQAILDNVFGPWAKQANISFQITTNPAKAQIRVGAGTRNNGSLSTMWLWKFFSGTTMVCCMAQIAIKRF